ncbi:hypothetical protein FOA52_011654 [Chlamydomonas sp. UWO 241]|nr:hypothetical protein FOA52_011654 [Chlamydomonas sp. UWO 241]
MVLKKQKTGGAIVGTVTKEGIKRTSNLQAPIMQLSGHGAEVFSLNFSPDGLSIASGGFDKLVYLWRTFGECENYMVMKGHKNAVLEVQWTTDGDRLVSCSADKTARAWDAHTGLQIKKCTEHDNHVNSVCPIRRGPPLFVTGSDDASIKVWDHRWKRSVVTFADKFQVTAVAFADAGDQVYSGGLDNTIKVWDLRKDDEPALVLRGHGDTVTGLRTSPDGSHLLSNSMDNTLRVWDMRPYAPANRCVKLFTGHAHTFERNLLRCDWSPDGSKVTAGSADCNVNIWDAGSRKLLYKLPGHKGSVNASVFHPKEPIVGSASSDRTIFLGELMIKAVEQTLEAPRPVPDGAEPVPSVRYELITKMQTNGVRSAVFVGCTHVLQRMPELSKLTDLAVTAVCTKAECAATGGKPPQAADPNSPIKVSCESSDAGDELPAGPDGGVFEALIVDATPGQSWGISAARVALLQASMHHEGSHLKLLASFDWGLRSNSAQGSPPGNATMNVTMSSEGGEFQRRIFVETGATVSDVFTRIYAEGRWEGTKVGSVLTSFSDIDKQSPKADAPAPPEEKNEEATGSGAGGGKGLPSGSGASGGGAPWESDFGSYHYVAPCSGGGSGPGSCPSATVGVRAILHHLVASLGVESLLDAPCGSFVWARLLMQSMPLLRYTGVDVACSVINAVQLDPEVVKNLLWQFHCVDVAHQQLPSANMILTRDALQHLPVKYVTGFLEQAKRSGAKWLAVGSYPYAEDSDNKNISIGDAFLIDLARPPFNLTGIVQVFEENAWAKEGGEEAALALAQLAGGHSIPGMPLRQPAYAWKAVDPEMKHIYLVDVEKMAWAPEEEVDAWLVEDAQRYKYDDRSWYSDEGRHYQWGNGGVHSARYGDEFPGADDDNGDGGGRSGRGGGGWGREAEGDWDYREAQLPGQEMGGMARD